ncbi:hypothetical protein [Acinetobacter bereziniae]|uniref:hypothetical protein n=1 Tax=Acinetobacter bereziniae TaxID=106648 RepID=UPI0019016C3A|nr:hypothetical protein [Acinetobacter bereziniae]MBJ8553296.1 hypothetical protein [Acinetobacter bereziniae]
MNDSLIRKFCFLIITFIVFMILIYIYYFIEFEFNTREIAEDNPRVNIVNINSWNLGWIDIESRDQSIVVVDQKVAKIEVKTKRNADRVDVKTPPAIPLNNRIEQPMLNIRYLGFSNEKNDLIVFLDFNGENKPMRVNDIYEDYKLIYFNDYDVIFKNLKTNVDLRVAR